MRYLLEKSQYQEIAARCEYLYDIFHLYFLPHNKVDGFIPLVPIGTVEPSILFIVGHQDTVKIFLEKNITTLIENTIVIISCLTKSFQIFKYANKILYVSVTENDYSYTYSGSDYGFGFDITKSEINFYNSLQKDIFLRLGDAFQRL